jgi:dihydroxyacetone kinase DhaKLM complex PTS-EIIA-like component DhaM
VDHPDIFASTAFMMKKSVATADPKLGKKLIQAHAEAIKRYYDDKAFAVKSFMIYDKGTTQAEVERVYDLYAKPNAFERVPFILSAAVKSVVEQQADAQIAAQMKAYDFHKVIDNSYVERLIKDGFFEKLYGPSVKAEQDRKAKLAFK